MQLVGKKKSNIPKALNICIPPYFPSNRTVLLSGLKARHILTKTTSKQPSRQKKEQRYQVLLPNIRVQEISRSYLQSHQSLKASEGTDTLLRHLDYISMNARKKKFCLLWVEKRSFLVQSNHLFYRLTFSLFGGNYHPGLNLNLDLGQKKKISLKCFILKNRNLLKLFLKLLFKKKITKRSFLQGM